MTKISMAEIPKIGLMIRLGKGVIGILGTI